LRPDEAESLLRRQQTGRLAFVGKERVTIVMVTYVYGDGWIYARMPQDSVWNALRHNQWVAFEVDEVHAMYDWRTVTIHGSVQFLDNDRASPDWKAYNQAAEKIRSVAPWILTPDDPIPERTQLYRIYIDDMVGYQAHQATK
jgi:hypothetical protein